jgi:hypothetical protein
MSGFGSTGFGSTPYGIGTPPDTDPNGGTILSDAYSGAPQGGRSLDPVSRDYVMDPTFGRIRGMSNAQQLVLLAISTDKGSAAMAELGQQLKGIKRITNDFEQRVDGTLRGALAYLVARSMIEVKSVNVMRLGDGRAYARLVWRDLTTSIEHEEEVGR